MSTKLISRKHVKEFALATAAHRAHKAQGIARGDRKLAGAQRGRVARGRCGQAARLHLKNCQILARIVLCSPGE